MRRRYQEPNNRYVDTEIIQYGSLNVEIVAQGLDDIHQVHPTDRIDAIADNSLVQQQRRKVEAIQRAAAAKKESQKYKIDKRFVRMKVQPEDENKGEGKEGIVADSDDEGEGGDEGGDGEQEEDGKEEAEEEEEEEEEEAEEEEEIEEGDAG